MKKVEVVSLIYKSKKYLDFIVEQLNKYAKNFAEYEVSYRIVANDPTEELKSYLVTFNIPFDIYLNDDKNEYYINRVYRAYNFAVNSSKADYVCLINSDMCFNDSWISNLITNAKDDRVVVSKLVESGKLRPGQHAIKKYFGHTPETYSESDFLEFKDTVEENKIEEGGLFMPLLISKSLFIKSGGYPEGNIYASGIGTTEGPVIESGDSYFFKKLKNEYGVKHYTVFNSIAYHFQEGEKDD